MKTVRSASLIASVSLFIFFPGIAQGEPASLQESLALYNENRLDEALPLLEQLVGQDDSNPDYHCWLAETYRRLGRKEEAVASARKALALDPCNSFAHVVMADASNPVLGDWEMADSDTVMAHIMKAVACDSTDGNAWLPVWGESLRRGQPELMRESLRGLVMSGFLTETALAYGRWMLRAVPENAVLLTNGDMDTYPPCAVQETENFRTDVAIVNRGTMNTLWYARFVRDNFGVPLPFNDEQLENLEAFKDAAGNLVTPSDQIFRAWLDDHANGNLLRPLVIAPTVHEDFYSFVRNRLRYGGSFLELVDEESAGTPDTKSMKAVLEGVNPDAFFGPWISDQDRSPVRRMGTRYLVQNVTGAALALAESLLDTGGESEAKRWLLWAEEVDNNSELGPVFSERITELTDRIEASSSDIRPSD